MLFRKKPVVISADRFFYGQKPWPDGCEENWDNNPMMIGSVTVKTLEGRLHVSDGDWIITGVKGEKYPCKPDIFKATYDPLTAVECADHLAAEFAYGKKS